MVTFLIASVCEPNFVKVTKKGEGLGGEKYSKIKPHGLWMTLYGSLTNHHDFPRNCSFHEKMKNTGCLISNCNFYNQYFFQMMNVNDLEERDDTNDSSVGTPGDGMDGRATMVPPSGLNYVSFLLFKCYYF